MTVSAPLVYQPPPPQEPANHYTIQLPNGTQPAAESAADPKPGLMAKTILTHV